MADSVSLPGGAHQPLVGVIGAGHGDGGTLHDLAYQVGALLAAQRYLLICGGLGGVMAAACQGAKAAGGMTLGLLPGRDAAAANPWVDIAIPTGLGEARNLVLVRSAAALIALGGSYGTLSEIAFALQLGKPLVGIHTWQPLRPGASGPDFFQVETAQAAVDWAIAQINARS
ncbi:TIGR00725 family protein [Lyngbya confervoides]|uniref:TIGR00725 family protein n=1 Tax=Lyngbya confervoides BDU141951 TaxID=1574623 RepID=A0ABD4T5X5_9CYAN|nr:TIGR00725 family protein [Lyngbya confervoides]MCM1983833.1 TIGR00725 family protein [Lyngbya confervoides BDU141951]